MPPPKSLDSYPAVFALAVRRAWENGEFAIPAKAAASTTLRLQFYGYLRAMRAAGQAEMADAVYIENLPHNGGIKLINKESMPAARDIAAALGETRKSPGSPLGSSLFGLEE